MLVSGIYLKMDGTASQKYIQKFKIEVRICIPAVQQIHNEQDKLRNFKKWSKFDVIFGDRKQLLGQNLIVMKLALLVAKSETTY